MSVSALLIHTVTITRPSTRTSDSGDLVKSGVYAATTVTGARCWAQQLSGDIPPLVQREKTVNRWRLTLEPTTDVHPHDRATVTVTDGSVRVMEVVSARPLSNSVALHHVLVECEEVTG